MTKHHKFRLCFAAAVVVLAVLVLILSQAQRTKATSSPPAGPHQAGDVWVANLGGRTTMAMAWCPPGKFLMGSPVSENDRSKNETQHEVTLTQGFWLGKYEVTQAQWQAIMGTNPSYFPPKDVVHWKLWKWEIPVWRKDFLVNRWQLPVELVSWDDCQEFCRKAGGGYRLPTEAEWEYACRAGGRAPFNGSGIQNKVGWYYDNSGGKTHPVGRKQPNAWGLCDMHGNVLEWCQDWYESYLSSAVTDPMEPASGASHVIRSGSWGNSASSCRAAYRWRDEPGSRNDCLGFRVAFTPAVPSPANRKTPAPAKSL